jgi:starvation-inducible DNA-binding protein
VRDTDTGIEIGIAFLSCRKIADGLSRFLPDSRALYMRTHMFYWNVESTVFLALHGMFEKQYAEQWRAPDEIAERVRTLCYKVAGSRRELAILSSLPDAPTPKTQTTGAPWCDSWSKGN